MTMRILCVHQGYELYGSDRTFLSCVDFLRQAFPNSEVRVLLPKSGPLMEEFGRRGISVEIEELWVLRRQYGVFGLLVRTALLPRFVFRALRQCRTSDLVYINTAVIVDYLLAAYFQRERCIIHVHEILEGRLAWGFHRLVGLSRAKVIFNSLATRNSFALPASVPQFVVHNGVDVGSQPGASTPDPALRVLLIGRINAWKGQDLLIDALVQLPEEVRSKLSVRIVGDVFEGAPFRDWLLAQIKRTHSTDIVTLEPFRPDPSELYAWADLVVIPSRKPEPFGLVAIEAMGHSRAVLAAGHGGLKEIVVQGETGWLHEPGDAADLARHIALALKDRASLKRMGEAGRRRFENHFTISAFQSAFIEAIRQPAKR